MKDDEEVKRLVKRNDINPRDNKKRTPLHAAAFEGYDSTCSLLIVNKAEIDAKDNTGSTPLHYAAKNDKHMICRLLIAHKAKIDAKNDYGCTPLHAAAFKGSDLTCSLLLVNKAEIDAKDNNGSTPLHYAAQKGKQGICRLLIELGANIHLKGLEGKTPFEFANENGHYSICRIIKRKQTSNNRQSIPAIQTQAREAKKLATKNSHRFQVHDYSIKQMSKRMDKLENENEVLRAENEILRAAIEENHPGSLKRKAEHVNVLAAKKRKTIDKWPGYYRVKGTGKCPNCGIQSSRFRCKCCDKAFCTMKREANAKTCMQIHDNTEKKKAWIDEESEEKEVNEEEKEQE